jgi:hypothetical protein
MNLDNADFKAAGWRTLWVHSFHLLDSLRDRGLDALVVGV